MVFSSTIDHKGNAGDRTVRWGTFTNTSGSTGGDITTGLAVIEVIMLSHSGTAAVASAPAANETFPKVGDGITIVTTADADGLWIAWGR